MALLKDAVEASRCVVLFAMEQAVIPVTYDIERAKQAHQVILGGLVPPPLERTLIAWNWQIFESSYAKQQLVLYTQSDAIPKNVLLH